MNVYNKERLHSAIDYNTPDEVYYKGVNNKSYELVKSILGVGVNLGIRMNF